MYYPSFWTHGFIQRPWATVVMCSVMLVFSIFIVYVSAYVCNNKNNCNVRLFIEILLCLNTYTSLAFKCFGPQALLVKVNSQKHYLVFCVLLYIVDFELFIFGMAYPFFLSTYVNKYCFVIFFFSQFLRTPQIAKVLFFVDKCNNKPLCMINCKSGYHVDHTGVATCKCKQLHR